MEAFKELGVCDELAEAAAALGWKGPTEIQKQAIPQTLTGAVRLQPWSWSHLGRQKP